MPRAFSREDCLTLLPEGQGPGLDIQPLSGGLPNTLHRVRSSAGDDVVVRLHGECTELFSDRDLEVETLRRVAVTRVAPRQGRHGQSPRATVAAFIPGRVLRNQDFLDATLRPLVVERAVAVEVAARCRGAGCSGACRGTRDFVGGRRPLAAGGAGPDLTPRAPVTRARRTTHASWSPR